MINKASEYEARVEANAPLTGNDWDSLKLDSLRDAFSGLDYNHPIRNYVEQKLIAPVQTRLAGTGKRILHDPYNPFPKIPRSENFPDEFVYVGGPGAFFDGPVTSELQYCLFTCPGSLYENPKSTLTFKPLLKTREETFLVPPAWIIFGPVGCSAHHAGSIPTAPYTGERELPK